jgi:DNA-binding HxlR family transcriptional regulator
MDKVNLSHLTNAELEEAEDIHELMKNLDPIAQKMIAERVKGMKDMQDIMTKKSA